MVDELALQEQGDDATTEDFGHVLKVCEGDMKETSLLVEAAFQDDSVHVGMKSQEFS